MTMKYYYKAIAANTIYVKGIGGNVPFEDAGGGAGILATENVDIVAALTERITKRVGGVYPITAERYEELKKKLSGSQPKKPKQVPPLEQLRVISPPDNRPPKQKAPAAGAQKKAESVKQAPAAEPVEPAKTEDPGPTLRPPKQ